MQFVAKMGPALRLGYMSRLCEQWRIKDLQGGGSWDHGEREEREPITQVWGGTPSGVQGQNP